MEMFIPDVDDTHKYVVAVRAGKTMFPIQSYETLEELKEGYRAWREDAFSKGITKPVPVEIIREENKCKVLIDLLTDG